MEDIKIREKFIKIRNLDWNRICFYILPSTAFVPLLNEFQVPAMYVHIGSIYNRCLSNLYSARGPFPSRIGLGFYALICIEMVLRLYDILRNFSGGMYRSHTEILLRYFMYLYVFICILCIYILITQCF